MVVVIETATKASPCSFFLTTRCTIPCASQAKRHLNVQKSSEQVVFLHVDLEMRFAPQRRALFRRVNFQKCSEPCVFCTFSTWKCASSHNACIFSTSQLRKVVPTWCVLYILTWKCFALLCATAACTFSTSQLPKVVREWCAS